MFLAFLEVLRPIMRFIFHIDLLLRSLIVLDVNKGFHSTCPRAIYPMRVTMFPFQDAIHHKYSINRPKQHAILLRIERRARWSRFRVDMINGFLDVNM